MVATRIAPRNKEPKGIFRSEGLGCRVKGLGGASLAAQSTVKHVRGNPSLAGCQQARGSFSYLDPPHQ